MGREIKFRAWADGMMYQNIGVVRNLIILNCEYSEEIGEIHLEPTYYGLHDNSIKLMQFTGLHDKNGKEIYEADIVWDPATNKSFIVEWDEIGTGYLFHNTVIAERTHGIDYYEYEDMCTYGFEVIGNQFENPELLEQTS